MANVDFKGLLGAQVEDAERPKVFPEGMYSAIVSAHNFGTSSKKGTPFCEFSIKLTGPMDDVDMEVFEEAGGQAALAERKTLPITFYLTKDAIYRLSEFLEQTLQIDCAGKSYDESIPDSSNVPLMVQVLNKPISGKEGEFYMDLGTYAQAA